MSSTRYPLAIPFTKDIPCDEDEIPSEADRISNWVGPQLSKEVIVAVLQNFEGTMDEALFEIVCLQGDDARIADWLSREKPPPAFEECPICQEEAPVTELYTLDCKGSHRACTDCLKQLVTVALKDSIPPTCPQPDCKHCLSETELGHLFGRNTPEYNEFSEQQLRRTLVHNPNIKPCPTKDCKGWTEISTAQKSKVTCAYCKGTYCSQCQTQPYHFHCVCSDLASVMSRWFAWLEKDRSTYYRQQARLNQKFQRDLVVHTEQARQHAKEQAEHIKAFKQKQLDEKWKARRCRSCPNCARVVEKLDGCSSMVCGQDAHGGNQQHGCGLSFRWEQAKPYIAEDVHISKSAFLQKEPTVQQRADHGEYMCCDGCHSKIVGLRFVCIHCPAFWMCEECERRKFTGALKHPVHHVFRILDKPDAAA